MVRRESSLYESFDIFFHIFCETAQRRCSKLVSSEGEIISTMLIQILHSDRRKEYEHSMRKSGDTICRTLLPRYTLELNSISERGNQTLKATMRSLLIEGRLPISFWLKALNHAIYI